VNSFVKKKKTQRQWVAETSSLKVVVTRKRGRELTGETSPTIYIRLKEPEEGEIPQRWTLLWSLEEYRPVILCDVEVKFGSRKGRPSGRRKDDWEEDDWDYDYYDYEGDEDEEEGLPIFTYLRDFFMKMDFSYRGDLRAYFGVDSWVFYTSDPYSPKEAKKLIDDICNELPSYIVNRVKMSPPEILAETDRKVTVTISLSYDYAPVTFGGIYTEEPSYYPNYLVTEIDLGEIVEKVGGVYSLDGEALKVVPRWLTIVGSVRFEEGDVQKLVEALHSIMESKGRVDFDYYEPP